MNAIELAEALHSRLIEVGSETSTVWDKPEVDRNTKVKTHAQTGVSCTDRNVSKFLHEDFRLKGVLDQAEGLLVLPFGDHILLIFSTSGD